MSYGDTIELRKENFIEGMIAMTNLALAHVVEAKDNVIHFDFINGGKGKSNTRNPLENMAGKDSEVYAFKTKEEISSMINVFDKHINEATNDHQRQIACRNKMLFIIGINVGIRGSDLRTLQWSFFFEENVNGNLKFRDFYTLQPMKQRKQKKYVKLHFNQAVRQAILNYVEEYPIENLNDYLFASRKGDEPINVRSLWRIIKEAAAEAGIQQNIGSHSLRKTFGKFIYDNAENKTEVLVLLQSIFNHSSPSVTAKYIGITDENIAETFNNLNLGLDMI